MANVALLIAGGSGNRMHQDIPKQFITVNERPAIICTLDRGSYDLMVTYLDVPSNGLNGCPNKFGG